MEELEEGMDEMEALAAKALRPSRMLGLEDLLASELASAVLSEPLNKIRHVCEALMLLDETERKAVGISEEEMREAGKLYALATALLNAHINREMDLSLKIVVDRYAVVPWPFPQKEAAEWLGWVGEDFNAKAFETREERKKELRQLPHFELIYALTCDGEATMDTYKGLITRFVDYAMPKVAALMRKIVSLVSADSYLQALRVMRGKHKRTV